MVKKISVVAYNPEWSQKFDDEAEEIRQALGDHCLDVYHIGSTSVAGLRAKEDLDVLCIVDALPSSLKLQDIGYQYKGEVNIPLRYFFSKNTSRSKVNLHVVESGHGFVHLNLFFRDYLKTHQKASDDYAALKTQLANSPDAGSKVKGLPKYTLGKDAFIKKCLEEACYDGYMVNFCTHYREWEDYHRIRKQQIFDPIGVDYDPDHPTIHAEGHYHFVLYKGIKIVSVAHIEFLDTQVAALRSLATDEPCKNQGYGAKLMSLLEKWVKSKGLKTIKLHSKVKCFDDEAQIRAIVQD